MVKTKKVSIQTNVADFRKCGNAWDKKQKPPFQD
jgi:hypothetical protein